MPTRLLLGEGSTDREAIDACTCPVRRGMNTARWNGDAGNRGRPGLIGGRGFSIASGDGSERVSDRVVRPLRPGNAGGGKGPDFWCAFDDGKVRVIGDEPGNIHKDQEPSEEALL